MSLPSRPLPSRPLPSRRSLSADRRPAARIRPRVIAVAATLAALAACSTAPSSYVNDNQVYYRAVRDRYPVFVVSIDGSSPSFRPIPIAPGTHSLILEAPAVGGLTQPIRKTYPLTVEPCLRYYIAAQRETQLTQDWNLVVERTYPVGGCDPSKAADRAKTTAISDGPSPLSGAVAQSAASSSPARAVLR